MHHPVISIRCVAHTPLDSVSNDGATAEIRNIAPQTVWSIAQVVPNEMFVQVSLCALARIRTQPHRLSAQKGDTRFDNGVSTVDIDLEDFLHIPTHVETNTAGDAGRGAAVADIPADAKWPDWNLKFVAKPHHPLHFWYISRSDDGRADEVLLLDDVVHLATAVSVVLSN